MAELDWTKCPWYGAEALRIWSDVEYPDSSPYVDWSCGSHKRGQEPIRNVGCEIYELEAKVARLEAIVRWAFTLDVLQRSCTATWDSPDDTVRFLGNNTGPMPNEIRQTILDVLEAANPTGGEDDGHG